MFLTLNELSVHCPENTVENAKLILDEFVLFCKTLQDKSIIDEIVFPESLYSISLCNSYGLSQWLSDDNVMTKHKQFFMRFLDKHCRYYNSQNVNGEFSVCINEQIHTSVGCAFAIEHCHILLSLPTNKFWETKVISGEYSLLDEFNKIQTSEQCIGNVWTRLSQEEIVSTYRKEIFSDITSGQDLWEKREQLYPNLIFCDNVKKQLFDDSEKYHINAVMKKLDRFQEYFSNCSSTYNPKDLGMGARTESETVKSDPALKNLRLFKLPDGKEEYFFDHVGFSGKYSSNRIHFFPDAPNKKCYIGYIGKHLKTDKF